MIIIYLNKNYMHSTVLGKIATKHKCICRIYEIGRRGEIQSIGKKCLESYYIKFYSFFYLLAADPSDVSTSTIDSYSEYLAIEMNDVQISGDYLPPYSLYGIDWVNGKFLGNGYSHMSDCFDVFANEYECDCYIGLWTSLEKCGFDSFEDLIESWSQYCMDDDAVCILYIDETKDAYVHVGENISQQFDADGFINVLCEEEEKDEFYRIADAFDNLCDQAGQSTGEYLTKVTGIGGETFRSGYRDGIHSCGGVLAVAALLVTGIAVKRKRSAKD